VQKKPTAGTSSSCPMKGDSNDKSTSMPINRGTMKIWKKSFKLLSNSNKINKYK
jgi:hypothetical protein